MPRDVVVSARSGGRTSASRPGVAAKLARWRVSLGFLSGAVVLWFARPSLASLGVGAAIAACGEALRIWAAGHLNKSREVTTSGPYRWLAHPLYVGSAIMGIGLGIASASVVVALLIAVYLIFTIGAAIRTEERFLRQTFGDRYERYRSARETGTDGERRFSLALAMRNREYRAALGLAVAIGLLLIRAVWGAR